MFFIAFPDASIRQVGNASRAASWATDNSVRPVLFNHPLMAVLINTKEFNGFQQRFRAIVGVHTLNDSPDGLVCQVQSFGGKNFLFARRRNLIGTSLGLSP